MKTSYEIIFWVWFKPSIRSLSILCSLRRYIMNSLQKTRIHAQFQRLLNSSPTPHPKEPRAEYYQPGYLPFSSPRCHETAVSSLLPLQESPATTSSDASAAQEAHGLCTRFLREIRARWIGTGYHQLPRPCVEPGVGKSLRGPRRLRSVWVKVAG